MHPVLVILLTYMYLPTLKFDLSVGFCNNTRGFCCENYVYQDGKCIECPVGTFGHNCTKCPPNYYGRLCSSTCDCSHDHVCNPSKGCIDEPTVFKAEYDSCVNGLQYSNRSGGCCVNQWKAEQCTDCWEGYFGENCQQRCPHGRFGQFCLGRCSCSGNEICDRTFGCFVSNVTEPAKPVNWKTTVGLVLGLLFIAFILVAIIKLKKQKRTFCNSNLTNVDISTTTVSEVSRVKVSEYPTMQRGPGTDVGIQSEAYSHIQQF